MQPSTIRLLRSVPLTAVMVLAATGLNAQMRLDAPGSTSHLRHPVIYVMPNAASNPGQEDDSRVVVDSSHIGKEPQVAKIYQELQRQKECQPFSENMIRQNADYFL